MDINKPSPQRFAVYTLLPDGKSFTIKDCKFVFKLDRYGGWRDEYSNYYNANGEPDFEPEDADLTPEQASVNSDSYEDEYEKLYGGNGVVDDFSEQEEDNAKNLQKIAKNLQTLSTYPVDKQLRVYFSNMPHKLAQRQIFTAYSKKIEGIKNVICDLNDKKMRTGDGHFIMNDVHAAEKLVKLQAEKVTEREVYFKVEKLDQLVMDPIRESELVPSWQKKVPQYFNSKLAQEQKKQDPVITKVEKIQENIKVEEKKESSQVTKKTKFSEKSKAGKQQKITEKLPQFINYSLNFEIFDTKTRFVNWMTEQNATRDVDYKNITKKQENGKSIIYMDVRPTIVEKTKGMKYNGKQVKFIPTKSI